jgi:hypothetical protein
VKIQPATGGEYSGGADTDDARERARAAREAAEQATTEYARRAYHRVADLHGQLALGHEDHARTLRFGGGRERE